MCVQWINTDESTSWFQIRNWAARASRLRLCSRDHSGTKENTKCMTPTHGDSGSDRELSDIGKPGPDVDLRGMEHGIVFQDANLLPVVFCFPSNAALWHRLAYNMSGCNKL
jgi:hypothetical protein